MASKPDVEAGEPYAYDGAANEREALLPTTSGADREPFPPKSSTCATKKQFGALHLVLAFLAGTLACGVTQLAICGTNCFFPGKASHSQSGSANVNLAPPYVGSTEVHKFPPASPTNANPTLFPTSVGYAGATPTGAEAAVVQTAPAYPLQTGAAHLVVPSSLGHKKGHHHNNKDKDFDLLQKWGNLSPWYSNERGAFGLDSSPDVPETCRVTGLHFLHRHGARYPTSWAAYGGPANLARRLNAVAEHWNASGDLEFLNDWTYKLGEEILTPFGRQQLYDLGISMRLKYGFLLKNFTESNTIPVFRTESQHRMLQSALNFALGFFGYPLDGKYQQSITIEADGFNNTLAPYKTCPNANDRSKASRSLFYVKRWAARYLKDAIARLQPQIEGYQLTVEDVYTMQQMCAYETVAIGYSKFCELFTVEEWEGFNYALDLSFWYDSAFGSPVARVQGVGWVKELVARLTHTRIEEHNTSTNATLDDDPTTFPLGHSLYVDATHEVVVLNVLTALNLTNFAKSGPLPYTHIPHDRAFEVSRLAPFATNVQFQLLECASIPGQQIRIIINDGVTPLTGIKGCPEQRDGMCPVDTFVEAQKEIIAETDWRYDCYGDWTVPQGPEWNTTTGSPPKSYAVLGWDNKRTF
ncbi:putative phosphoglycerate mutase-like protein [Lyophyllum shimeji]|uniref:Phosphoglycerate mutase-like protein n=1 Tax=Lyophyllum shimeji TaxID=47721 RepID=A0A9P3ULE3_LYOSH|nr:putative phosphoglycerate mutase-like protein [Lyophyllum shimeji]